MSVRLGELVAYNAIESSVDRDTNDLFSQLRRIGVRFGAGHTPSFFTFLGTFKRALENALNPRGTGIKTGLGVYFVVPFPLRVAFPFSPFKTWIKCKKRHSFRASKKDPKIAYFSSTPGANDFTPFVVIKQRRTGAFYPSALSLLSRRHSPRHAAGSLGSSLQTVTADSQL